jgi:ribonuclease HII
VEEMVAEHPEWDVRSNLKKNKGYGTAAHLKGLKEGVTDQHRRSYAPVRAALGLPVEKKKIKRGTWAGEE